MYGLEETIDCIDCGGCCHLLVTWAPDNLPVAGDVVAYRCEDCLDRWDVVVPEPESGPRSGSEF
ncbi:MAG TPA: hypothetical protein VFA94_17270 [Acidimicrobiales bacterium]|nr:hypothetical protein [Acidimicrobiales bacterium]